MGKSPGKWIKTLLFGKKSSRSQGAKRSVSVTKSKEVNAGKGRSTLAVDPQLNAEQVPTNREDHGNAVEMGKSVSPLDDQVLLPEHASTGGPGDGIANEPTDAEKSWEEQAAIRAQAAFRGYLARRAFRALKGIIRLQALIRGHLVRRQAVSTLHCMWGIVKLQAVVRGMRVRNDVLPGAQRTYHHIKDVKCAEPLVANFLSHLSKGSANAYIYKLFSSSIITNPLQLRYNVEEPNSAWNWLERWTYSTFWKPPTLPKKTLDSKPPGRHYALETESGRSKRSVRRNFASHTEPEPDKPKRNVRKVSGHPVDPIQENPQSELERVKRNLRKVSSSMTETSDWVEVDMEKPKRSMQKISNACTSNSVVEASDRVEMNLEKPKHSIQKVSIAVDNIDQVADTPERLQKPIMTLENKNIETASKRSQKVASSSDIDPTAKERTENVNEGIISVEPISEDIDNLMHLLTNGTVDEPIIENHAALDSNPPESTAEAEKFAPMNGETNSKEEVVPHENQKSSKRRASFSSKPEYTENGVQNTPKLPSYMAATESAKAKLRGQNSPRFGSDEIDKNAYLRRHSLPSSINGKLNSLSPRTQRLVQTSGKGGLRSDRSLLSSRDGSDKPIQVEWRR